MIEFVPITIFPESFPGPLGFGVVGKGFEKGLLRLTVQDLRAFADPPHYQVDDAPYGGGAGMVMRPEPLFRCVEALRAERTDRRTATILLDPAGRPLTQTVVRELATWDSLILICGRYEGVDERVRQTLANDVISVGDYVLSGGELPAMTLIDAVSRLIPGVVGSQASVEQDSFDSDRLDHPHFTRPASFRGMQVPEVLLSGHHAEIASWRAANSLERTRRWRPDLLRPESDRRQSAAELAGRSTAGFPEMNGSPEALERGRN